MEKSNQDQNKEQKQNNKIIPQSINEVESLNDSEELDIEDLEGINGAADCCGHGDGSCCTHGAIDSLEHSQ